MENTQTHHETFTITADTDNWTPDEHCCMCGKKVKGANLWVHTYGGGEVIHPEDEGRNDDRGYTGMYRIGTTCAKQLPDEYIIKE